MALSVACGAMDSLDAPFSKFNQKNKPDNK